MDFGTSNPTIWELGPSGVGIGIFEVVLVVLQKLMRRAWGKLTLQLHFHAYVLLTSKVSLPKRGCGPKDIDFRLVVLVAKTELCRIRHK